MVDLVRVGRRRKSSSFFHGALCRLSDSPCLDKLCMTSAKHCYSVHHPADCSALHLPVFIPLCSSIHPACNSLYAGLSLVMLLWLFLGLYLYPDLGTSLRFARVMERTGWRRLISPSIGIPFAIRSHDDSNRRCGTYREAHSCPLFSLTRR